MADAQKHMQIDRKTGEESIHKYDKRSRGILASFSSRSENQKWELFDYFNFR